MMERIYLMRGITSPSLTIYLGSEKSFRHLRIMEVSRRDLVISRPGCLPSEMNLWGQVPYDVYNT